MLLASFALLLLINILQWWWQRRHSNTAIQSRAPAAQVAGALSNTEPANER